MPDPIRHSSTPLSNLALFRQIAARLSERQRAALAGLSSGAPITEAASAAGVHRSTLHLWLSRDPAFQSAYAALTRHQAESASGLIALARAALEALLADPALAPELRLRAIQIALRSAHSLSVTQGDTEAYHPLTTTDGLDAEGDTKAPLWGRGCVPLSDHPPSAPLAKATVARNAPCPCGSGRKFKRCCGATAPPLLHSAAI